MRHQHNTIAGSALDHWDEYSETHGHHYIEMLVDKYANLPANTPASLKKEKGGRKGGGLQEKLTKNCRQYYDSADPDSDNYNNKSYWCPISHAFIRAKYMRTAHLVPFQLGEPNAQYLFSEDKSETGHIFNLRNGLPMHKALEAEAGPK